jgi:tRNA-Thr(GGU) m(6)t(6)A37 methyltransferase TsaA
MFVSSAHHCGETRIKEMAHGEKMNQRREIVLHAIGVVRSPIKQVADDCWGGVISTIELDPTQFALECTLGLTEYSHIDVIFHLSQIADDAIITGARHPRGRQDWPNTGIFAQRAKARPNRIAVTTCRLEGVAGLSIRVHELDAVDGTPVLDIKPYFKGFAPRGEIREPAWAAELMAGYFRKA